jgi:hypothetical protein
MIQELVLSTCLHRCIAHEKRFYSVFLKKFYFSLVFENAVPSLYTADVFLKYVLRTIYFRL